MSDVFDRNVVLFIFFVVFLYLKFLEVKSSSRSTWKNLTCDPLKLFSNSLFQTEEEANKDFERCVVNISAATTKSLFAKEVTDQETAINAMAGITTSYTNLTKEVDEYIVDVSNAKVEFASQIKEVQTAQSQANDLNTQTKTFIQSYLDRLQDIFDNITNYIRF